MGTIFGKKDWIKILKEIIENNLDKNLLKFLNKKVPNQNY